LGVGHNLKIATALHCVESMLREEIFYYSQLFPKEITYKYKTISGDVGTHTYLVRKGKIRPKKLMKYMDQTKLIEGRFLNLDIYSVSAEYLIDRSIELGRKGITMYLKPKPKLSLFYPIQNA
jgi:aminoglycoside 3-N-acetyltransferase